MTRRRRRALWVVASLAALLLGVFVWAWFTLESEWFFDKVRRKRGKHNQEGAQGLLTHRLLGIFRLQRKVQELHHRTDGRIKAKTFEALRHLLEHNV